MGRMEFSNLEVKGVHIKLYGGRLNHERMKQRAEG